MTKQKLKKAKPLKVKRKLAELTHLLQKTQADFENFSKRAEREKQAFAQFANESLILELLPVLDNFERSLKHSKHLDGTPHQEGLKLIKKQLADVLKNNGVEKIEVRKGDRFNPELHEAVEGKGDRIAEVILDGYQLNGKLIRAARVRVDRSIKN